MKPTEHALKGLGVGDDTEGSKTCSWWTAERAVEETYDCDLPGKDLNGIWNFGTQTFKCPMSTSNQWSSKQIKGTSKCYINWRDVCICAISACKTGFAYSWQEFFSMVDVKNGTGHWLKTEMLALPDPGCVKQRQHEDKNESMELGPPK